MVKKITVFAIMASLAMAAPTTSLDRRTFGLGGNATGSISTSSGWNSNVAGALEACRSGVASGSVDAGNKQALLGWLNGAGSAYLDFVTCYELKTWCSAGDKFIIGSWAQLALDASFAKDEAVSAAGSVISFLNGVMFEGFGDSTCLCSVLSGDYQSSLLTWLESSAAAGLDAGLSGALHACAAGGIAASLSSSAQTALSSWLSSAHCSLSAEMKGLVKGWLTAGGKGSAGGKVGGPPDFSVVLTSGSLSSLHSFIGGSAFGGLDVSVQAGLHACAAGGVAGSLDLSIHASLSSWISSLHCPLDAGLKAAIGLWLQGSVGTGVQAAGTATFPYVTVGSHITGNLSSAGYLIGGAQASLSSFCSGSAGATLDAGILASLKECAAGGLVVSLEASAASALSAWLSSSSCTLGSEMRGTVIAWMSFGITGAAGAKAGVGAGAGAGYTFSSGEIASIKAAISGSSSLSATVKGAFGLAIAGQAAGAVSIAGRAELSAFLCSDAAAIFGGQLHGSLIGWTCGSVGGVAKKSVSA